MRFAIVSCLAVSALLIACTTNTTNTNDGSSSGGEGTADGGGGGGGGDGGSSGSSGGDPKKEPASTTAAEVEVDAACQAFTACGGSLSGTYDYTAGCVGDVFADFRPLCAALDTSGVKATVTGSIYFLADSALERDVTVEVSGDLKFPSSCVGGQCTAAETELKKAFTTASCVAAGADCTCTIASSEKNTASTTFTVAGNSVTTADGDAYEFCVEGDKLSYSGKTAEAEGGSWEMKKR